MWDSNRRSWALHAKVAVVVPTRGRRGAIVGLYPQQYLSWRYYLSAPSTRTSGTTKARSCCHINLFIGLGRTTVLCTRSVTIGKFTVLDDHEQRDRLWRGIHQPDDDCFHADAKSSPGNATGPRDCQGARVGGKKGVGVGMDPCFDIWFGVRLGRLRARLSENFRDEGGVLIRWAAPREQRQRTGSERQPDLHDGG
jgi:hypothetical protein